MTQKLSLPTLVFGMSTIVLASHSWAIAELSDKENYARNKNSVVFLEVSTADKTGKKDGWTGSGFIVSQEGHVLTNAHVVPSTEDFDTVTIVGCAGTRFCAGTPMEVIKREQELDLALLKFRDIGTAWEPVQVGVQSQVSVGEEILVLGYPLDQNLSLATGKISSRDAHQGLLQTSTPLNRGTSGGPAFNKQGEVVAVVVGGNRKAQLINFLIPINYARGLLQLVQPPMTTEIPRGLLSRQGFRSSQDSGNGIGDIAPSESKRILQVVTSWPGVRDTFDGSDSDWDLGSRLSDEVLEKWESNIIGGRYRWNMIFSERRLKFRLSPYGSVVDFFAEVEIVFGHPPGALTSAGLSFGHVGEAIGEKPFFQVHITPDGEWGITRVSGSDNDWVVRPIPVNFDPHQPVKIGILVEDGFMRFFVNNFLVSEWMETKYQGGEVALLVSSQPGEVLVEFDSFVLKRKPRA